LSSLHLEQEILYFFTSNHNLGSDTFFFYPHQSRHDNSDDLTQELSRSLFSPASSKTPQLPATNPTNPVCRFLFFGIELISHSLESHSVGPRQFTAKLLALRERNSDAFQL
jgi:hypothetical protein